MRYVVRHSSSVHRRGFAIMSCLLLIAFIGITVSAMTSHFAAEANRTRHIADDAQLRQLLVAASIDLHARLNGNGRDAVADESAIALPKQLVADSPTLSATRQLNEAGRQQFRVTAAHGSRSARQSLEFRKVKDEWQLHAAKLLDEQ